MPGPQPPDVVYALIEIPRGSRNRYELVKFGKQHSYFSLTNVLHAPIFYTGDYGIIPQTLYEDGDPLDIIVLVDEKTFPGCVIEARPIGVLELFDNGQRDDKIIAVPVADPRKKDIKDLKDLPASIKKEISHFFRTYKEYEGKDVEIIGWKGIDGAKKAIMHGIKLYDKKVKPTLMIH